LTNRDHISETSVFWGYTAKTRDLDWLFSDFR